MNVMVGVLTMRDRAYFWNNAHRLRIHNLKDKLFPAAEHYFDSEDNEIAMIYNPKTNKEEIFEFDTPRHWPQEIKDMYVSTKMKKEDTMFLAPAVEVSPRLENSTAVPLQIEEIPIIDITYTGREDIITTNEEDNKRELISIDKEVISFWENCPENFAHLVINGHLRNIDNLKAIWNTSFIEVLDSMYPIKDSIVIDYGCGGAHLGMYLHKRFGLKNYIAMDIAKRQRDSARNNLVQMNQCNLNNMLDICILEPSNEFSEFNADLFISLACMQYFPSIEYLEDFLLNINDSGIKTVVLQYRHANETHIANTHYKEMGDVYDKCYTNADDISEILGNYALDWVSDVHGMTDEQYIIFQLMEVN